MYLAKRVALLPEVRSAREEKLGGGTLEPERVSAFLHGELEALPLDERAIVGGLVDPDYPYLALGEEEELKDLVGGWENRGLVPREEYSTRAFREALATDYMGVPIEPEPPYLYGLMHLVRDGTGRTLEDVGRWLSSRYGWALRDAAWFVLTGKPQQIEPVKVTIDRPWGMYTLTIAPWISEETIRRAYRSLHDKDNRPLGEKGLSAFRFVEEHTEPGQTPRWAELTRRWNSGHPDERFTDGSALRRAHQRAEKRLGAAWVDGQEHAAEGEDTDAPDAVF